MIIKKRVEGVLTIIFVLALIFLSPFVSAFNVTLEPITDVVAIELTIPAKYNVTIKNDASRARNFSIYTLVDLQLKPEFVFVEANSEKSFVLEALPPKRSEGSKKYNFYVRAEETPFTQPIESSLIMKILPLDKILIIDLPSELARDDKLLILNLKNKENINLGTFSFSLVSELFNFSSETSLQKEAKNFSIPIDLTNKHAGTYNITFNAFLNNEYNYKKIIAVTLKEVSNIIETKTKKWHFFGYTNIITKKNEGNVRKVVTIELPISTLENAFTSYNIQPTTKARQQNKVIVVWQRELQPGESFTIEARTNYTTLVVVVIVVAIALIFYLIFFTKKVVIKKKAIRLKTKGDEFAAKVIIVAKNLGKEIRNVKLVDRLPMSTKLYEKFGTVKPDKIEKSKVEWNFASLLPGEEVVTSYIIYSKVGMTHVELPAASLSYADEKGKTHTISSAKVIVL
ncbi:MAG: hypothetical protein QXQ82_00685 [Candidatus Pacearchaeota archaeon]